MRGEAPLGPLGGGPGMVRGPLGRYPALGPHEVVGERVDILGTQAFQDLRGGGVPADAAH
ncbi:hypothetical protein [Embleya scabrispora]|uniref:hypothetical protein n=1 Tax=Embleya scabrispora TaxID=159449 RepID=UPI000376468B|nr:hypothetical protein [Embleya scabrispora]MYS83621.1 hypothetical protein [Streptomyces sp. SID5474]